MAENSPNANCLNCGKSEMEVPLVQARFAGKHFWICANCMPVLIHKTDKLIANLQGINVVAPANSISIKE